MAGHVTLLRPALTVFANLKGMARMVGDHHTSYGRRTCCTPRIYSPSMFGTC